MLAPSLFVTTIIPSVVSLAYNQLLLCATSTTSHLANFLEVLAEDDVSLWEIKICGCVEGG